MVPEYGDEYYPEEEEEIDEIEAYNNGYLNQLESQLVHQQDQNRVKYQQQMMMAPGGTGSQQMGKQQINYQF